MHRNFSLGPATGAEGTAQRVKIERDVAARPSESSRRLFGKARPTQLVACPLGTGCFDPHREPREGTVPIRKRALAFAARTECFSVSEATPRIDPGRHCSGDAESPLGAWLLGSRRLEWQIQATSLKPVPACSRAIDLATRRNGYGKVKSRDRCRELDPEQLISRLLFGRTDARAGAIRVLSPTGVRKPARLANAPSQFGKRDSRLQCKSGDPVGPVNGAPLSGVNSFGSITKTGVAETATAWRGTVSVF